MSNINEKLDFSSLFEAVGIDKSGTAVVTEHTYDFDPNFPKNHWLYASLLGFKEYKKRYGDVVSFASIGVGPGIEAIGIYEILKPSKIFLTDIHPEVPEVAKNNVVDNVGKEVEVLAFQGDLCQPLITRGLKLDLVYANIPNIPSDQPTFGARDSASFYIQRDVENCPIVFNQYLLTLQFLFLKEAKNVINKGGAVIDAIGGRVPYDILVELFTANGYKFEELVSVFKIQTEPNYVLKGYCEAEQKYGVDFDFYKYEDTQKHWIEIENKNLKGQELKNELKKYRVNATYAYNDYLKNGSNFGHVVHILCGRL